MSPIRGHKGAGKQEPRQAGLGAPSTTPVPQAYGTDIFNLARTKLYDALDDLRAAMAFGYIVKFDHIYNHHRVAKLEVPAVTVDLESAESGESIGGAAGYRAFYYNVTASVRVHMDYTGGTADSYDTTVLLSSINNYLSERADLAGGYRITLLNDIKPRLTFEDSATLGGELTITIRVPGDYAQA
jgi:hypothetical protein